MNGLPNIEVYDPYNNSSEINVHKESVDESVKKVFLRGNPFLYNSNYDYLKISSIDEYYVKFKGEEVTFGEVVHSHEYGGFRKKRFVKKTLKKWKKDYLIQRNRIVEENLGAVELIGEIKFLKFRTSMKIVLLLVLFLIMFISFISTGKYIASNSTDFIFNLSKIVVNGFNKYPFIRMINSISIYLLSITLLYSFLYSTISNDFKRIYNLSKKFLKNTQNHISRDYKKKYKKVRKFYLKKISMKKVIYPGYDIKLVGEGKNNLEVFEEISKSTVVKARRFKNTKLIYIITKYILVLLSLISSLIVIIYIIYEWVRNLL